MTNKTEQELRALAEAVSSWTESTNTVWPEEIEEGDADFGITVLGHLDEDGSDFPIAVIDADTYGYEGESLKLAKFYAAANPVAVIALLDRIAQLEAERDEARAQLAQRQVPADGWVMVPREPTETMLLAMASDGEAEVIAQRPDLHPMLLERSGVSTRYAAMLAASPTPPQREPLTDEQIEALRKKTFSTDNPFCPCDSKTMRKAVWAAEAAHGIGVTHD